MPLTMKVEGYNTLNGFRIVFNIGLFS